MRKAYSDQVSFLASGAGLTSKQVNDIVGKYNGSDRGFNAQTNIKFTLTESQDVILVVYDLLGREVQRVVDGYEEAGIHSVLFDNPGLSSGIYFYCLQVGIIAETKKMILLK